MLLSVALALLSVPIQSHAATNVAPYETAVRAVLGEAAPDGDLWDLRRWREPLERVYVKRAFTPLWFTQGRLSGPGSSLLQQLVDAESRGLRTEDYDGERLARLAAGVAAGREASVEALARLDVALSVTAARLVSDLHLGRVDPHKVGYDLDVPQPAFDAVAAMSTLAAANDVSTALDALEPQLRHYQLLKTALARYRELAKQPQLTQLPPLPRSRVHPGESYIGAPALRRLLFALGDLPEQRAAPASDDLVLDPEFVAALAQFQSRHGLDADGVLGRATFLALTTPLAVRVQQIVLSLERVRWLPPRLESPPIIVNIPQFRLFAFRTTQDFAQDILQMDVIVGAAFKARQTPVFAADMRYVVLNPYWDVPYSILVKELLPAIQADPGWVTDSGYEIVLGLGDDAIAQPATERNVQLLAQGKLRLRQKPGPANALGQVKFMFPNRHNVYLHDTPARSLFQRSSRAFSHGCIRVSDPLALLAHVLRDDPTWTAQRIAEALRGNAPVRIALIRPIRVFILYATALATESGRMLFFPDLYDQDALLQRELARARREAPALRRTA
jgi:murein L,D-transpeptidase YcbB/YkuD